MNARVYQNSLAPAAEMTLRVVLTEYRIAVPHSRATITALVEYPDGVKSVLTFVESKDAAGVYEVTIQATMPGVYGFRVLAKGTTLAGRKYTREQLLTGAVWQGGDRPAPERPRSARG